MKGKITKRVLLVAIVLIAVIIYVKSSNESKKGYLKMESSKKVRKDMTVAEVNEIMGKPDTMIIPSNPKVSYTEYQYATNDDSYPFIVISFDSVMKVKEIHSPL